MRHDLAVAGPAFRLRPVSLHDAAFIVRLRTAPRAAGRLHPISGSVEGQVRWLEAYFERSGDWYWIVERHDGTPEGTAALYDRTGEMAEWGRWILLDGSLAAPESALLVYRAAFEMLNLREVICRTVATNAAVISFHDHAGLRRGRLIQAAFTLAGVEVDAVEHRITRDSWPATRSILESRAAQVAAILARRS